MSIALDLAKNAESLLALPATIEQVAGDAGAAAAGPAVEAGVADRLPNDLAKVGRQFATYNGIINGLAGDDKGRFIRGRAGIACGIAELGLIEAAVRGSEDVATISATSENGSVGLFGGSMTSRGLGSNALGIVGVVLNDAKGAAVTDAWAMYAEAKRYDEAGITHCFEGNVLNAGSVVDIDPYAPYQPGATISVWSSSGRQEQPAFCKPATAAYGIVYNGGTFRRGIVVGVNALDPNFRQEAMTLASQHVITWYAGTYQVAGAAPIGSIGSKAQAFTVYAPASSDGYTIALTRGGDTGVGDTPDGATLGSIRHYDLRSGATRTLVAQDYVEKNGSGGQRRLTLRNTSGGTDLWTYGENSFFNDSSGSLGRPDKPWGNSYFTVPSTVGSDARFKSEPETIPDALIEAVMATALVQYQMLDAIQLKGTGFARLHHGIIAQHLIAEMAARDLDWRRFSLIGEDPIYEDVSEYADVSVPVMKTVATEQIVWRQIDDKAVRCVEIVEEDVPEVYEVPGWNEDGSPAMTEAIDAKYEPVMQIVIGLDGKPVMEPVRDADGHPVIDAMGVVHMQAAQEPALDPITGIPLTRLIQPARPARRIMHQQPRMTIERRVIRVDRVQRMEADGVTPMTRLALRYQYFLVVLAEGHRRKIAAMEQRLAALEAA